MGTGTTRRSYEAALTEAARVHLSPPRVLYQEVFSFSFTTSLLHLEPVEGGVAP